MKSGFSLSSTTAAIVSWIRSTSVKSSAGESDRHTSIVPASAASQKASSTPKLSSEGLVAARRNASTRCIRSKISGPSSAAGVSSIFPSIGGGRAASRYVAHSSFPSIFSFSDSRSAPAIVGVVRNLHKWLGWRATAKDCPLGRFLHELPAGSSRRPFSQEIRAA